MSKMILGVFGEHGKAEDAIAELHEYGYNPKDISIVMKDTQLASDMGHNTGAHVASGAASGATTGGVVGGLAGLLIGIGAIAIPGIGGLLIGGPLVAALGLTGAAATTATGAMTGAVAGGLLGGLMGLGVPEKEARFYEEQISSGAILLAVPVTDSQSARVKEILRDYEATQVSSVDGADTRRMAKEDQSYAYASDVRARRNSDLMDEDR